MRRLAEVRNTAAMVTAALVLVAAPDAQGAQMGTAFTYQGELDDGGALVTGDCDFEFSLWDDPAAGSQLGSTIPATLSLIDGRFTVVLNQVGQFGPQACNGEARWLQIDVCCPTGCSPLTSLDPRQELTPSPYAQVTENLHLVPGTAIALELGNTRTANVVLLGALSAFLDMPDETWQEVIESRVPPKYVDLNRQAFLRGRESVSGAG